MNGTHAWNGADGSTWDLIYGPAALCGVIGMGDPSAEFFTRSSPVLDGSTLLGVRQQQRRAFWAVEVRSGTTEEWLTVRRAFMSSLSYSTPGRWDVTHGDGETRSLYVRLGTQDELSYQEEPTVLNFEQFGVNLVADDPWWHGPAVTETFQTADDQLPFFAPPGDNHVFNIGSSNTVATATISNPGDVDAWPIWRIDAPATAFSVGVEDAVVAGSVTLTGSEYLIIDSHPARQLIQKHDGATVTTVPWSTLTSVQFARIPAGESVDLAMTLNGAGSIEVSVDPLYYRAW